MLASTHDSVRTEENIVRLSGLLDVRSVGDVRQLLNDLIDNSAGDVIVDLGCVDAIDATGLGLLIATHRRTQLLGRQLVLRHPALISIGVTQSLATFSQLSRRRDAR